MKKIEEVLSDFKELLKLKYIPDISNEVLQIINTLYPKYIDKIKEINFNEKNIGGKLV